MSHSPKGIQERMKATRRDFIKVATAATAGWNVPTFASSEAEIRSEDLSMIYRSSFIQLQMSSERPTFASLFVDSLGNGRFLQDVMLHGTSEGKHFQVVRKDDTVEYRCEAKDELPAWSYTFTPKGFILRSFYSPTNPPDPLTLEFDPVVCHATLLGLVDPEGAISLPAVLHFPASGSIHITTTAKDTVVGYDAMRGVENYVRVSFRPASAQQKQVEYRLETVAIYPDGPSIQNDSRYDGYRRDFISIFQLNPRRRALANNSASDCCGFALYFYSMTASVAPPLVDGLHATDLMRDTLDRYVGAMKAYGMKGYGGLASQVYDTLDTYPSLVISASNYVSASNDTKWLKRNYSVVRSWAEKMVEFDIDGDGLMEYPLSGNSGSWPATLVARPANWWDTIGFGHKDAYSNALAFEAFQNMVKMARQVGSASDAVRYLRRAELLKRSYYPAFFNPATGVLAGWRSADGELHDYYFLFVGGVAVTFGLLTNEQGNRIWDRLLEKMREVGYESFRLGLPGNLIPVRRDDYVDLGKIWGGSQKADGSDGFQIYENGGATACYVYFTIQALRKLGRRQEADSIFYPMLQGFKDGGFQGRGPNGQTYDWMAWDGTPHGYEGLLVESYLALLAGVPTDYNAEKSMPARQS